MRYLDFSNRVFCFLDASNHVFALWYSEIRCLTVIRRKIVKHTKNVNYTFTWQWLIRVMRIKLAVTLNNLWRNEWVRSRKFTQNNCFKKLCHAQRQQLHASKGFQFNDRDSRTKQVLNKIKPLPLLLWMPLIPKTPTTLFPWGKKLTQ